MPAGLIAALPAIAAAVGIAGTGVTIGETLANQPSGAPQPVQPPTTAPTAQQPTAAQIASLNQQGSNVQSQTGGSLAPASFSQMAANLTGNPGDAQTAQQVLFGQGGQGLSDMIAQLNQAPAQSLTQPQG